MILSLLAGFILGAAALLFALQNTDVVSLSFLGWQFESSLALLVLAAVAAGILISILASIPSAIGASFRIMGLKKENKNLAKEVEMHRSAQATPTASDESSPVVNLRD
ncbi:MAG TPA: LapA family protein [Candidatus Paceibacterota bacterium]|nr:LapA family protein [Candidatus Paceibacterota bacterium]